MKYILAIDQGTTSSRAILFDKRGRGVATAQKEFPQHYPKPGWVEHDPEDLWRSTAAVVTQVMKESGADRRDVAAVGITNQRETTVVWDRKTGKPVSRAIVWQDRRTADLCAKLRRDGAEPAFQRRTGLRLDPYFSGTKVRWILDHVSGARTRARQGKLAFGTVDSWLLWRLTGGKVHATDLTNASRTLLCNLRKGAWDDTLVDRLALPHSILPEIRSCSENYGEVTEIAAIKGVPVTGIAGDQQAALFGQACFRAGMAKNTYGTGCFLLLHTGDRPVMSRNRLLTTPAWKIGDRIEYALEGSVFIGGAVVQWLRDGLGLIKESAEVEQLAAQAEDSGGVHFVPAFTGLGAPWWAPDARGLISGLTRGTTAAHLARAAVESIAHQVTDLISAMEADARRKLRELRVDGGATVNNDLLQFQADLLRRKVVRPRVTETTALGAAYLAGLAVGFWSDRKELSKMWESDAVYRPRAGAARVRKIREGWQRAVKAALL